ncbi:MAG: serine hydrolase [Daejeonella sp.]|uniref:serine hydrolase domain-containing protein n=1 Tax=Daejeonella sp. TaxID=2805397 RepID=UPI003C73C00E
MKEAACICISAGLVLMTIFLGGFDDRVNPEDINADLSLKADAQQTAVLLNNTATTIPLVNLKDRKIATINIGSSHSSIFNTMLRNYAHVDELDLVMATSTAVEPYTTLIIQVNAESLAYQETVNYILGLQKKKEVILVGYGNTFALGLLGLFTSPIIWNPENSVFSADYSAQLIFGGATANNRLKETVSLSYPKGAGFSTGKIRLRYSSPEDLGISSYDLNKIDGIVKEAIDQHATPSAVVMVVKNGSVIFNRAYGSHTYGGQDPTHTDDIYDVASVTKTAATTMAVMRLYEQQKLDLNGNIGTYFPEAKDTNKEFIPLKEVMLHQAGFINLDFFSGIKSQDHSTDSSYAYPVKVADNYFVRRNYYQEAMLPKMLNSPIRTRGQYVYSDISMYMMKEVVEHQSGTPLDQYVQNEFYTPLGMRTAGFNPRRRFDRGQIVPTEQDNYFRKTLLQGYVHDQGAALVNGVSGHAGLFASANDLAILNQVLLNGGKYGGVEYFKPETVDLFTARQSNVSRRGLGFDRGDGNRYPSALSSVGTFGHTGYTGTAVWVDPKNELIYIFLSNRVYPSVSNRLNSLRIRPRIQDVIYEAISKKVNSDQSAGE